ncbi:transposable element Tcb1 transposase [Trichonephila clavipes]|nr:transposable element Tcb1 transposase [Trichonephila clavipes]GFU10692.1 transposable element Tcb1 transposase [Trichonephila clavipes]GFU10695.1 transposable element Tcb1 transposase [Trichonephila clavipes]
MKKENIDILVDLVLKENCIAFDQNLYKQIKGLPQNGGIYQQDIAECHTTDSVRAWFKEHQDQFIVLLCPENSPDLSPINTLWNPLDRVVRVMDPHARNLVQQ